MKQISRRVLCVFAFLLLSSCQAPTPSAQTQVVTAYATSAAQYWLTELYACAANSSVTLNLDARDPDIFLQIGEPNSMTSLAYKIGEEEIMVVANNANAIANLSLRETQQIFSQENPAAQVWVFASGEDIQRAFDQLAMRGIRVVSSARVAASADQMSARVAAESSAIGILPKRGLNDGVHEVFSAGAVPVLAVAKTEPQGIIAELIACLQ
ncbi:MAG: hypothetical protein PHQ36_11860 [Anaerolineales bacterium]|nr:hypothetical protein [Anaerolineales bacterium]